ncbi:hypothetical protein [Kangiella sediminilitoris]|uniref:Secreted protein n=1 Tax=Kangiella sediminilitoris TaxID=1144748 RepID=A0A1B3BB84_9GAMM|nr:hypothetical protein [Kangiella sediminilitoris]AOE50027.1 hypothetical protein KS2013_1313 [Kangiella sediminilitoris]
MNKLLLGAILFLISSTVAQAGNSARSGHLGDYSDNLFYHQSYRLQTIDVKERYDKPCFMEARFLGSDTNGGPDFQTVQQNNCRFSPFEGANSAVGLTYGDIRYLRVCHSSSGRVKGYKIGGYNNQGLWDTDAYVRPNCSNWKREVYCPKGEVANGIRGYFKATSGTKSDILVGMQLLCRAD